MPSIGHSERFIGKVSATLEMTCREYESSSVTDLLQIQPTWTSPTQMFGSPEEPLTIKTGCVWHYGSASHVSSTNVSDHVQHLLSLFLPIKSRIEEMRPIPRLKVSILWECTHLGLNGLTGPQFRIQDLRGIVELGAKLQVKVVQVSKIDS